MVFNILCNNNDDHLRNHGFLHTDKGYVLSPAYDLVPQLQAGEARFLSLGVGTHGKDATVANALTQVGQFGLTDDDARTIVAQLQARARAWRTDFERSGVTPRDREAVEHCFGAVLE